MELDLSRIVPDPSRTIRAGALAPWSTPGYRGFLQALLDLAAQLDIPVDVPFEHLSDRPGRSGCSRGSRQRIHGAESVFSQDWKAGSYKLHVRVFLSRWRRYQTLPGCHGARLRPEALAVKIDGRDIAALSAMTIRDARALPRRSRQPCAVSRSRPESWLRSRAASATWARSGSIT